ncbi:MAG: type II toxin-antitoxin system VapB family antitoxin [Betaproteobacteria bacterium]|nr:type II toxin-antitoxin system VapB family antitoxin [Betaproteobacteria bacterium]
MRRRTTINLNERLLAKAQRITGMKARAATAHGRG